MAGAACRIEDPDIARILLVPHQPIRVVEHKKLTDLARRPVRLEAAARLKSIGERDEQHAQKALYTHDWLKGPIPKLRPTYGQVSRKYGEKEDRIRDPTTLIVIDEADRLRIASLEQVRAIFDPKRSVSS